MNETGFLGGFCIALMVVGTIRMFLTPLAAFIFEVNFIYVLFPAQCVFLIGMWSRRRLTKTSDREAVE
ncbi:hypothetical protein SAMN05421630_11378 [Prauserella marina]|uniref:Uncharacterized protein n=1 Tax=Prauserella marina TaxID=530584 RepID=A0A1G6Y1P4_9PSEU|nr:hypothetical protein DES30_103139 [Prauserella marina]SDD84260.1 hypothetical protein SAMN05421630_11378 [Prauserella marina]